MPKEVIDQVERMARQEHAGMTVLFEDRDHNEIIDLDHEDDDDDSDYEPNNDNDDDNNDNDDDDDNNAPTNQPNEPYKDPGTLGEEHAQQYNNEENNNENDIVDDNNNNDDNENGNNNIHDEYEYVEPTNDNDSAPENVNAEETEEAMDHNPGGITGVDPEPLPPIQVQNEQTQRELNRIAWMGQQPATFARRTRAQARVHATTNVTTEHNTMTDFEQDLFHRQVAGTQLPPEYEDQLATLKHTVLTQYTLKKVYKFSDQKGQRQYSLK